MEGPINLFYSHANRCVQRRLGKPFAKNKRATRRKKGRSRCTDRGLNLLVQKVQDGDAKGQRWSVFKTQCMIKDRACKMIIDGGSFTNAISKDVVNALGLSM